MTQSDEWKPVSPSSQFDFIGLFRPLWSGRYGIILASLLAFVLGVAYVHNASRTYQATMYVTQTDAQSSGSLSDIIGRQASTLINFGRSAANQNNSFALYVDGLKSRVVADRLAQNADLMHRLFSSQWDPVSKRWFEPPRGMFGTMVSTVFGLLGFPKSDWHPPSAASVAGLLTRSVTVLQDPTDPVVEVDVTSHDPQLALDLLNEINVSTDGYLKETFLKRSENYIAYLNSQVGNVSSAELRLALIESLATQEKTRMMASSNLPFAAQPFGKAFTSSDPKSPKVATALMVSLFAGALVGSSLAFFRWAGSWRSTLGLRVFFAG